MANNQKKLKAFVRYDGSGRVVASSLILRKNKPRVGRWYEIPEYLCCNGTTNTTTTQGGVTPTAFIRQYWTSEPEACVNPPLGDLLFYSASSVLQAGITIFQDAGLNNPVLPGRVIDVTPKLAVGAGGLLSVFNCPNFISGNGAFTQYNACNGPGTSLTLYYTGSLGVGTALFTDVTLTTPYNPGSSPSGNGTYLRLYFQAEDQVCTMNGNVIQSYVACSSIVVFTVQNQRWGNTAGDACSGANPATTFYTTGPLQGGNYLQDGNVIYLDEALTQPVQYPYIVSPGITRLLDCSNGVLSNQRNC